MGEPSAWGWEAATSLALEEDLEEAAEEREKEVFDDAPELAAEKDADTMTKAQPGHPTRAILNRVAHFDAVVMGSQGSSLVD